MFFILLLCALALIGAACAKLAVKRGRDPSIWFWLGLFFGLIGFTVLYFLKNLRAAEVQKLAEIEPEIVREPEGVWYILDEKHVPQGPLGLSDIRGKFKEGILTMNSYLWNEEWPDWKLASESAEFRKGD